MNTDKHPEANMDEKPTVDGLMELVYRYAEVADLKSGIDPALDALRAIRGYATRLAATPQEAAKPQIDMVALMQSRRSGWKEWNDHENFHKVGVLSHFDAGFMAAVNSLRAMLAAAPQHPKEG
jgi:hypothetical protein